VLTDTDDMYIPHSIFRAEFARAPGLVRAVRPGDLERAKFVDDNVRFLISSLTHHHQAEDALLWPLLHERATDDAFAETVSLMESQHHGIHEALDRVSRSSPEWAAEPTAERGENLATELEHAAKVLEEHLAAEEAQILPVAAQTLSQEEWEAIGERSTSQIPKDKRMLALGSIHYYAPPAQWTKLASGIPWLLRPIIVRKADKTFRKQALALHGTATP
jgi:hemerythrin-like domain-containing protein